MKEKVIEKILMLLAFSAIGVLLLMAIFIFKEGIPIIFKAGINNFLFSTHWAPTKGYFGIFSMIVSSLYVTIGSLIIGVPLALACAITLAELAPLRLTVILKPTIELLAGIPSVVYGFLGVVLLVPLIRDYLGGPGLSLLTASIILAIMILPTITSISIDAIQAVPYSYKEGSLALGATHWQTIRMVILKAARSGIITAIILGMGRAIGETMAVIMVAGNALKLPSSPLSPVRPLTSNIALEMGYAAGDHRAALFATGIVLFVFIMVFNVLANIITKRWQQE
ncbi:MAG: phosphate ABC transporter permease subunit PstC [Nitrospirota bacterium]